MTRPVNEIDIYNAVGNANTQRKENWNGLINPIPHFEIPHMIVIDLKSTEQTT